MNRKPADVLAEARLAATALADVIKNKKKPVVINGETYLEFEDWATVARFYGTTVGIVSTTFVQFGDVQGFEARAEARLVATGEIISTAESMCLSDENMWKDRPLFQLRSMAQTRAQSKVLRNVFSWVVVLAGYKPTPAEEMQGVPGKPPIAPPQRKSEAAPKGDLHEVIVKLVEIEEFPGINKKTSKPYVSYKLKCSDEGVYQTFDKGIADNANEIADADEQMRIVYTIGQYGAKIESLEQA